MLAMQNELKLDPQHTCKKLGAVVPTTALEKQKQRIPRGSLASCLVEKESSGFSERPFLKTVR